MAEREAETETTLEEAARMLAAAQQAAEDALREFEEAAGPYEVARAQLRAARKEVARIEQGMGAVVRGSMVRSALDEAGIEFDGPLLIAQPVYDGAQLHYLAAVGPEGTGLYVFKPARSHRYHGVQHVIFAGRVEKFGAELPVGTSQPAGLKEVGAVCWEARGRGQWGDRSGAMRPVSPPEGGRWRWLKVREQETITTGEG